MAPKLADCEDAAISNELFFRNMTDQTIGDTKYSIEQDCKQEQGQQENATEFCNYLIQNDCFVMTNKDDSSSCFITCNDRWLTIGAPAVAVALCFILVALIVRERLSKHRRDSKASARDAMSVTPQCSDSVVVELASSFPEQHPKRKYSGPVDLDDIVEDDEDEEEALFVPPVVLNASSNDEDDEESRVTNSTPVISNRFSSRRKVPAPMLVKEITVEASSLVQDNPSNAIPKEARPPKQPVMKMIAASSRTPDENASKEPRLASTLTKVEASTDEASTRATPESTITRPLPHTSESGPSKSRRSDGDPHSFSSESSRPPQRTTRPSRSMATEDFEPELDIEL